MRSDTIKRGFERAPHRSLLRATGQIKDKADFAKPFIAECNSYIDIIPGHVHLQNCDKIVPGMLMGAARVNIPTIFVSGGPMQAGIDSRGEKVDLISVFEGVGAYAAGTIDAARLEDLEANGCPTCGSCSGMFTANSMNCLCEALGVALPGNGSILATSPERHKLARMAAFKVMELLERNVNFLDIVTPQAIDNAIALDVAMGGSTNTVLHVLALAREAGLD